MKTHLQKEILKDMQVKKFCLYGFLKNLKFFEPYLLIYLLANGINLFQIGILIAIREIFVNLFELPSGFIADYFGRKKELYFCFGFYITSFIIFFLANSFILAAVAMMFFGMGEAFRSGTHKAMIYTYLDFKSWQSEKTFVYGRTRSCSLIGSATSGVLGILLILFSPDDNYIFLFSVLPYLLDLLLIISYPKFLDIADKNNDLSFKQMIVNLVQSFRINIKLRNLLIEEGIFEAAFSYVKDLIQPILEVIIIGSGISLIVSLSADDNLKILLGFVYAVLNLFGSYFSKKAYLLKGKKASITCLLIIHICYAFLFLMLAVFSKQYIIVCIIYVFVYIFHSVRKPIFIDEIDNNIEKFYRATIISTGAQLKSLFLMIFAPILGYIGDNVGLHLVLFIVCIVFLFTLPLLKPQSKEVL